MFVFSFLGQDKNSATYRLDQVMDERYGITMYDDLNQRLEKDTLRLCQGRPCRGWVKDYYESGSILHEGFYEEGKLHMYKNYYVGKKLEREFKTVDDIKSVLTTYYLGGKVKSKVVFQKRFARKWQDFFENGALEFYEEYDKKIEYLIRQDHYYRTGKPKTTMKLVNKKKKMYEKKVYHSNGKIKEQGAVFFSMDALDYQKKGPWKFYDEKGNLISQRDF